MIQLLVRQQHSIDSIWVGFHSLWIRKSPKVDFQSAQPDFSKAGTLTDKFVFIINQQTDLKSEKLAKF